MGNLKLSKTAIRELTRLYRGVLVAAIIATAVASTGAKAADYYVSTTNGGDNDTKISLGTAAAKGLAEGVQEGNKNLVTSDLLYASLQESEIPGKTGAIAAYVTGKGYVTSSDVTTAINAVKSEAETIFAEKQDWVDQTLGIESAHADAVKEAYGTDAILGSATTLTGADLALSAAISDKQTQLMNDASTPGAISATVKTSIADTDSAVDTALVTEKAIATALAGKETAGAAAAVQGATSATVKDVEDAVGTINGVIGQQATAWTDGTALAGKTMATGDTSTDVTVAGALGLLNTAAKTNADNISTINGNITVESSEVTAENHLTVGTDLAGNVVAVANALATAEGNISDLQTATTFTAAGNYYLQTDSVAEATKKVDAQVKINADNIGAGAIGVGEAGDLSSKTIGTATGNVTVTQAIATLNATNKNENSSLNTLAGLFNGSSVDTSTGAYSGTATDLTAKKTDGTTVASNVVDAVNVASTINQNQNTALGLLKTTGEYDKTILGSMYQNSGTQGNTLAESLGYLSQNIARITGGSISSSTGAVENDYMVGVSNVDYTALTSDSTTPLATAIGQINKNIGVAIDSVETRGAGAIAAGNTVNANIKALDQAIGGNVTSTNNGVATTNSVNANISAINAKVGNVASVAVNGYDATATDATLVNAVSKLDSNMETVLGGIYKSDGTYDNTALTGASGSEAKAGFANGQTNLASALANYAGNVATATGITYSTTGAFTNSFSKATTTDYDGLATNQSLVAAIGQLDGNIGTAMTATGSARTTTDFQTGATKTVNQNLSALDAAIGTDAQLTTVTTKIADRGANNGVKVANSVNANIATLNSAVGDMTNLNATYTAGAVTGNAITNGGKTPVNNVVDALNNIDATLGTIHGLKAKMAAQGKDYGNLADGTTVEEHIVSVDAAIGDRSQFAKSFYMQESAPVADAMMSLDRSVNNLENRVNKMHHEMKSGFASLAAMSALVPNARVAGDTQLAVGTGYYRGTTGFALGAFHHINDSVLLNAGASYAGNGAAVFKGGVTFGF